MVFLPPFPLVSLFDQPIVLKSRNLPNCVRILATPSLPLSSDVICEWPLYPNPDLLICARSAGGDENHGNTVIVNISSLSLNFLFAMHNARNPRQMHVT